MLLRGADLQEHEHLRRERWKPPMRRKGRTKRSHAHDDAVKRPLARQWRASVGLRVASDTTACRPQLLTAQRAKGKSSQGTAHRAEHSRKEWPRVRSIRLPRATVAGSQPVPTLEWPPSESCSRYVSFEFRYLTLAHRVHTECTPHAPLHTHRCRNQARMTSPGFAMRWAQYWMRL